MGGKKVKCVFQMCLLAVLLLLGSSDPKRISLVSLNIANMSWHQPRWLQLFLLSSDTQVDLCYPQWLSTPHHKLKLGCNEMIISIDKTMVTLAQAAKNLVQLQLSREPHMASRARSMHGCARQHTWNHILPSSPGPTPLMAVKSSFFSDSPAVSSSVLQFFTLFFPVMNRSCLNANHIFPPNICDILFSRLVFSSLNCSQTSPIDRFPPPIKLLICDAALSPNTLEEIKVLTFAHRSPVYFRIWNFVVFQISFDEVQKEET